MKAAGHFIGHRSGNNTYSSTMPTSNSLIERLLHYAQTNPAHDAVATPIFTLSYAQLAQLVRTQARRLNDAGISAESVIGIKCADDAQHLVFCLATIHVGAASCTVPAQGAGEAQAAIIGRCGVTHLVDENMAVDPLSLDRNAGSTLVETPAAEARLLFSTSGTTGEPKLVVHHDSDLVEQAHRHIGSEQERFACLASIEHNFAKRHRLYCVAAGATNVFLEAKQESVVAQCQSLNVNVLHVSAFQAQELLATPDISRLSNIRLKLGGSHVPLTLRQQLRDKITNNLQAGYGTTETGAIAFTDPNDPGAGESVGQPLPGIEIRAVTPQRKPLDVDERGELAIRCAGMFRGYLGKSALAAAQLEDGWFYTGDIGYLDSQQRIHLCGRSDDMFVFNSMNIYPQDIESQICQHPGVTDAVVLPKTSSVHGNIPVALVVFAKGVKPDLSALKKFVQERVGVRSPRQFTRVDEIPRNASGKISRHDTMSLPANGDQIRSEVVRALNTGAKDRLKPSLIAAFEKGEKDISLSQIGLDSLGRMNLLVMLEVEYDIVITPEAFGQFRTLGDISAWVLSSPSPGDFEPHISPLVNDNHPTAPQTDSQPYVLRFFRRIFSYCHTAAQLNKALGTLEHRLTPTEVAYLFEQHLSGQLIPSSTAAKFQTALARWFRKMNRMMRDSGKQQPEPFISHRIAPTVTHFAGTGSPTDKTLLVCFSGNGDRHLMMPNSVLMQHTDAARYDLLVIAEPLKKGYRFGVPSLGKNVTEVIEWVAQLELISSYRRIRTLGCSAGTYPAVIAAYRLGAEMAVAIGGRFHSERYAHRILNRVFTTWRAVRKGRCSRVLMSYAADNSRDRRYARVIASLTGGSLVAVEFTDADVGHLILQRLVERGELAPYLARTIFAKTDDETIATERASVVMAFPATELRPYG